MKKCLSLLVVLFVTALALKADFLELERKKAIEEGKLILLSVEKEGCPYCLKMQKEIFSDPQFNQRVLQQYVHVSIIQNDFDLPEKLHVKYFPTNLVLAPSDLSVIDEFAGYMTPKSFLELLDEVSMQSKHGGSISR